jgi:alanyl-tRNA synthetase
MITRKELIKKYIDFFKSKNHKEIPNSSLIPENDPTVLFTTAGMHPLVPYLLGQPHPLGKRLCNVQRCIRTGDIEEVGDETHHTFFEMLGNWSLGDYWKKEAIKYSLEFLTKVLKIPKEKISVTCFKGDKNIPKDKESENVWKSLGIKKIKFLGKKENWWGPAGNTGPCGPDTEVFVNNVEIWNAGVFMQYNKTSKGKFELLKQKNIDTGMGVERTIAILNGLNDNYLTECFKPIIEKIEELSGKKYNKNKDETKSMRIIADHIKASVFIIADGIVPSNMEQGYVLRRLIRRAIRYGQQLGIRNFTRIVAEGVFEIYNDYSELTKNKKIILDELKKEEEKFSLTLEKGMNQFRKFSSDKKLSGKETFLLYQSYGFPLEIIEEECKKNKIEFKRKDFEKEFQKHQKLSRTATAGKFKSGLADQSEKTTKLHTATHLLLAALRIILDDENIMQKGSNITAERLRLDFNFPRKLTKEEIKKVEDLVNAQIQKSCEIIRQEMSPAEAKKKGAVGVFDKKYGKKVSVYTIEDFSKEICAGPHVKNTCEIGHFKITKEESSSAGVRRIKAVVE